MYYWFTCKVKYMIKDEEDKDKKVTAQYMLQASNYTEAEANIHQKMEEMISASFFLENISKSPVTEIYPADEEFAWFKVKVQTIEVDPIKNAEMKSLATYMVAADSCKDALQVIDQNFRDMAGYIQVQSVAQTQIKDIFPHDSFGEDLSSNMDPYTGELIEE